MSYSISLTAPFPLCYGNTSGVLRVWSLVLSVGLVVRLTLWLILFACCERAFVWLDLLMLALLLRCWYGFYRLTYAINSCAYCIV